MDKTCLNCEGFIPKSKVPPFKAFDYIAGNKVGCCNFTEDITPLQSIVVNCELWEVSND